MKRDMRNIVLTPQQKETYEFIRDYIAKRGLSPTLEEMKDALGKSSLRSVTQYLEALERKGKITRKRYRARNVKLVQDVGGEAETVTVPVFASAGCGSPMVLAQRIFDEYIDISSKLIDSSKKEDLFVIKAVGSSMVEAGIYDGDFVLVEKIPEESINIGDRVVAIIDDNAVIKKYVRANDLVVLEPMSPDKKYRPVILDRDSTYKIFGKVLRVIRLPRSHDYTYVPV